ATPSFALGFDQGNCQRIARFFCCRRNNRAIFEKMYRADHSRFRHSHDFVSDFTKGERRTRIVIAITGVMMVVAITAGDLSHSMALLADAWYMRAAVTAVVIT